MVWEYNLPGWEECHIGQRKGEVDREVMRCLVLL